MSLSIGTRVGPYEITAQIGAGGMGEVYRARDTKLDRDVAIKVLPEAFAADPERIARFQREAKTLASLNHPHIAAIYGIEGTGSTHALVMELVEGEDLSQRIARGPIPIDEALPIARQIAEALEAAHEQGIIHRDLKPANIKIRPDGTVKVLDFGLAKLADPSGATASVASPLSLSPTITSPAMMTGVGVLLGTAAYMSPEQAKGRPADKRSDIWAFGCVLYEMLTGRRPFVSVPDDDGASSEMAGADVAETLAAVIQGQVDWTVLPTTVPTPLRVLLRRCLEKERRRRVANLCVVLFTLEEVETLGTSGVPDEISMRLRVEEALTTARQQFRRATRVRVAATSVMAMLVAGAIVGGGVWFAMRPPAPNIVRTEIATAGATSLSIQGAERDIAITPDGSRIVYRGQNQLLVRALDQLTPLALTGLGAPRSPFVSPDGQWIGFFDSVFIKKVAVTGGAPVTVAGTTTAPRGATWGEDGTIVYAGAPLTALYRVSAAGGQPTVLAAPDRNSGGSYLWPEFLPGGKALLVTIQSGVGGGNFSLAQIAVLDLRTNTQTVLVRGGSHAHYVSPGYLVYDVAGALYAVAFDLARLAVVGTPVPVVDGVFTTVLGGMDAVVASNGTLAYVPGGSGPIVGIQRSLVWVGRDGREEPVAGAPLRTYVYPRLSPDGTQIALDIRDQDQDIWIWSLQRRTLTRFTFDPALDAQPVWTPDGRRLIWISQRPLNIYWQPADGTGMRERLTNGPFEQRPSSVTPDGTRLVFAEDTSPGIATGASRDLVMLPLAGDRKPTRLMQTMFDERNGEVSPDGRWLAYQSNESGQFQIFVRPFPAVDNGRWQVSTAGGQQPEWARNGRELFYWGSDGALMGVSVTTPPGGDGFATSTPVKLIESRYYTAAGEANLNRTYDVSPDGRRFLMIKDVGNDQAAVQRNLVVVQHFDEMLKRLMPTK